MSSAQSNQRESAPTEVCDRRESERFPPKSEPTYVWLTLDRRIRGRVIDESDGGIGIRVSNEFVFEPGFKVRVERDGERRTATIRFVRNRDNGEQHVGLSWDPMHD